jgi:hypothetical protein
MDEVIRKELRVKIKENLKEFITDLKENYGGTEDAIVEAAIDFLYCACNKTEPTVVEEGVSFNVVVPFEKEHIMEFFYNIHGKEFEDYLEDKIDKQKDINFEKEAKAFIKENESE